MKKNYQIIIYRCIYLCFSLTGGLLIGIKGVQDDGVSTSLGAMVWLILFYGYVIGIKNAIIPFQYGENDEYYLFRKFKHRYLFGISLFAIINIYFFVYSVLGYFSVPIVLSNTMFFTLPLLILMFIILFLIIAVSMTLLIRRSDARRKQQSNKQNDEQVI